MVRKCGELNCNGELGMYHHVHLQISDGHMTVIFGIDPEYRKNAVIRICRKCGHINVIERTVEPDF